MEMFKGFIEIGEGKKPLEAYSNKTSDELRSYTEVKGLPGYAGVIREGYTLVDIDDEEQGKKLLELIKGENINTHVIKTRRGYHFYFKSNPDVSDTAVSGRLTPLGLIVDYKHGHKNGLGNLKTPEEGAERLTVLEPFNGQLDTIPDWLTDLGTNKSPDTILDIEPGERNDRLFSYILTLQGKGLHKDNIKNIINLINNYMLDSPISQSEIDNILRDDAFKKELYFDGKRFKFDKFAKDLVAEHNMVLINGEPHFYEDGVYKTDKLGVEGKMIEKIPTLNSSQRREVRCYIDILTRNSHVEEADPRYILFKNGVYDLEQDILLPHDPKYIITNQIPHNYNPIAFSQDLDTILDNFSCNDKDIRSLLEEAIGYTLYRSNRLEKAFILSGDKSNGKSTFLFMIQQLLGEDNYSSLDLGQLGHRFSTAELAGKLANLGDDISDEFIADTSVFKKLVTGETMSVERKGLDPFDFKNTSKLFFSANDIPRMNDKTGAVQRRLVIIPFNARFTEENRDIFIEDKIKRADSMEYLINLGIQGLRRTLKNRKFTEPTAVRESLKEFEKENNPVLQWLDELPEDYFDRVPVTDVYYNYRLFCNMNGLKPLSNIQLGKQIKLNTGLESKAVYINADLSKKLEMPGGKVVRFYK